MKSGVQTRKQAAEQTAKANDQSDELKAKELKNSDVETTVAKTTNKAAEKTRAQKVLSYAKGPTVEVSTLEALLVGSAAAGAEYFMTGSPTSAVEKAVLGVGAYTCTKGVYNLFSGIKGMVTGNSAAKPAPKPALKGTDGKVVNIDSAKSKIPSTTVVDAVVDASASASEEEIKAETNPKAKKR